MKTRKELVEMVVEQIQNDIAGGDLTALYEMVDNCTDETLENYLPENSN